MRLTLSFFLLLNVLFLSGQNKHVCFSFDDMPVVSYGTTDTVFQEALMHKLITSLNAEKIPAIGFVNEKKLYENGVTNNFQLSLLRDWISSGLDAGNHTFSHPDYNTTSFGDYTGEILRGETFTRKLLNSQGKELRYFRHPFLHVGYTKAKADSLDNFLREHEYTTAPVTIDNEDYLFALAYHRAKIKHDENLMRHIGHDYVDYMEWKLKYFENESMALFGRNITQILLVHASALNSDYIDALAEMFRKNNYDFVSMDQALRDEAYKTPVTVYGKLGISWLDKWALSMGKKGEFFSGDPETPAYIQELAK
jgi:peptidoglycan/xylan/chitin deacetylase (PgdA/CDA1 family)